MGSYLTPDIDDMEGKPAASHPIHFGGSLSQWIGPMDTVSR
jgi:hypothetical protein